MSGSQELSGKFDPEQAAAAAIPGQSPAAAATPASSVSHPDAATADAADFPGSHDGAATIAAGPPAAGGATSSGAAAPAPPAAGAAGRPAKVANTPAAAAQPPSHVLPPADDGGNSSNGDSSEVRGQGISSDDGSGGVSQTAPRVSAPKCLPRITSTGITASVASCTSAYAHLSRVGHIFGIRNVKVLCQQSACIPSHIDMFSKFYAPCR